ncbi:DUF2235 domain-containing protein [Pedobacter sp. BMA]|uniref:T6SS phospholipase effector Tle1-like catalytic domain-containing protein n=1 Tax=Pedobacter sp. BMA TaxID=1663685 RepID=UPI00064A5D83|nr:DUF2235 domain-containing protein [Pedobacter sp. BMA]KLT67168.1 hypothetical protein AB669_00035 [Pedobacter sp. BMA]
MTSVQLGAYTPKNNTVEYLDINLGIFFDGTKNSKTNTEERQKNSAAFNKYGKDDDESSYWNDWSNVARLWDQYDKSKSLYIEGIGTEDRKEDSTIGYAFGSGDTGIRGKVRIGCEKIVNEKIVKILKANATKKLRSITLDVFGFSRGAAAARNFVYEIGKSEYRASIVVEPRSGTISKFDSDGKPTGLDVLPACGHLGLTLSQAGYKITANQIKVRFLGVFDTVSSYSKYISPTPNFNDVEELHLNAIGRAQAVVHFIAEDEHRQNFSLTRVNTGKEKSFPGVHSDVGGSYDTGKEVKEELETSWTSKFNLDPFKKNLIDQAWYKESELEITGGFAYWALKGTRFIKKEYSYIPLHFMGEYGKNNSAPINLQALTDSKYIISDDPLLVRVKGYLKDYVMGNGAPYRFKSLAQLDQKYAGARIPEKNLAEYQQERKKQEDLRVLRNKYLHWSARREGIGMDPNSDGKRVIY